MSLHFLKLVNCTNRHAKDFKDFDVLNNKINFAEVNEILDKERKKVDEYLSEVVKNVGEFYGKK